MAKILGNGYEYQVQHTVNNKWWNLPVQRTTGLVLHSIGCPQPKAAVLARNFNKPNTSASVHGFIEPGLLIETAPMTIDRQKAKKCYHVGGDWNHSRLGLEMCEPSTIEYIGGGNFRDKNPEATRKYVREVTETAAKVFADLCMYHGIDVELISTHCEAHKLGHGSGHVDPDHIWKVINYDITQFRRDVQAIINDRKGDYIADMTRQEFEQILDEKIGAVRERVYKTLNDVPSYATDTVKKCLDRGFLKGNEKGELNLSDSLVRLLVINDRAGLYDPVLKK